MPRTFKSLDTKSFKLPWILFLWKLNAHMESYGIATPYLIENDMVFPIRLDDAMLAYSGMPVQTFETKVKQAIAKNIDTN